MKLKYKRVLLKLSGETLMGNTVNSIDTKQLKKYAIEIKKILELGVEIAIVIGGGNIFRGISGVANGLDRVQGDYMGMLATIINGIALQGALEEQKIVTRLQAAIHMNQIAEPFIKRKAVRHLEKGRVVIFGAGTGNPYFTTDTAAILRGIEINADVILKGTSVDGIYTSDPKKNKNAIKYNIISFKEIIQKEIKIMDLTAFTLSHEHKLPIIIFDMNKIDNLKKLIEGTNIGTLVDVSLK